VEIMARLLRFDRRTGQALNTPDQFVAGYLAAKEILNARLVPNSTTTSPTSAQNPSIGGSYAAWSSGPNAFAIDLPDGKPRKLETDSTYQVAVVCAVEINALSGPAPASAQVTAQLFLRLATLGVLPHDQSTI
jgi:hypothetical protein